METGDAVPATARLSYTLAMPTRKPKGKTAKGKKTESPAAPAGAKLQRWVDLLAALLVHRFPVTFEELRPARARILGAGAHAIDARADVRARQGRAAAPSACRSNQQTVERDIGPMVAYVLRPANFYLPLLCAVHDGGRATPRKNDQFGYRASAELTFEPDELAAVAEAAARVRALGDPILAADAESALRKLAVDLPVDGATAEVTHLCPPRVRMPSCSRRSGMARRAPEGGAVRVPCDEHRSHGAPHGGAVRALLPRQSVVSRRARCRSGRAAQFPPHPDERRRGERPRRAHGGLRVPKEFALREHASSRQAWELGDADAASVTVQFTVMSGAAAAASKLGAPVPGKVDQRRFEVRRLDNFALWLLSFAGEAAPVEPAPLTRPGAGSPSARWHSMSDTAAAQLRRILHVIPQVADGKKHSLASVAMRAGVDVATLLRGSLQSRHPLPRAGWIRGGGAGVPRERSAPGRLQSFPTADAAHRAGAARARAGARDAAVGASSR